MVVLTILIDVEVGLPLNSDKRPHFRNSITDWKEACSFVPQNWFPFSATSSLILKRVFVLNDYFKLSNYQVIWWKDTTKSILLLIPKENFISSQVTSLVHIYLFSFITERVSFNIQQAVSLRRKGVISFFLNIRNTACSIVYQLIQFIGQFLAGS